MSPSRHRVTGGRTDLKGFVEGGNPIWGLAAVVARNDGSFLIIH
jgi:hypothetical protein